MCHDVSCLHYTLNAGGSCILLRIPCEKLNMFFFSFKTAQGSPVGVTDSLIRCINIPQMSLSWQLRRQRADYFFQKQSRVESEEKKERERRNEMRINTQKKGSVSAPVRSNNAGLTFGYILSPTE